jgi:hypothetical protein
VNGYLPDAPPYYLGGSPHDVVIDDAFWESIALLGVFADTYLLALITFGRTREGADPPRPKVVRPGPLLIVGCLSLAIAIGAWAAILMQAISTGQAAYIAFKRDGGNLGVWYPISRTFFDIAALSLAGALGTFAHRRALGRARWSRADRALFGACVAAALILALTMGLLGDRSTLAGGLAFGVMVAFPDRPPKLWQFFAFGVLALGALNIVGVLRERGPETEEVPVPVKALEALIINGEAATSLSMYSTLRYDIPSSHGQGVAFLLEAAIPRIIKPERTAVESYDYYANAIGLNEATGWGILLPTDLLINFGMGGLALGGVLLGALHAFFFRQYRRRPDLVFAFGGLLGAFPLAFRAGIPGLKGILMGIITGYILGRIATWRSKPASWRQHVLAPRV